MKRIIYILPLMVLLAFSACTKDKYYPYTGGVGSENGNVWVATHWYDEVLTEVEWEYNSTENRYEKTIDAPEIDEELYDHGTFVGTLFYTEAEGYEVQKPLPFMVTHKDANGKPYTVIVSCDISIGDPSTLTLFVQSTDIESARSYLFDYALKMTYIWDSGYSSYSEKSSGVLRHNGVSFTK